MSYIFIKPRFQCYRQEPEFTFEDFLYQQLQRKKQEELALQRKKQQESIVKIYSKETKETYHTVFEFPFYLHKQNFQIQVKEDKLTLEYEYAEGEIFSRQIQIPQDVEIFEISAKFKKNSLTIAFPRIFKEETIEIEFVKELPGEQEGFEIPQELEPIFEEGNAPLLEIYEEEPIEEGNAPLIEEEIETVHPDESQEPIGESNTEEEPKGEEVSQESTIEFVYPTLPTSDEKFKIHHEVLRGLGFDNKVLLEELIEKHNGNIQSIVKEYISRN
jgi:HSP20 family molecular chaperone IbpA